MPRTSARKVAAGLVVVLAVSLTVILLIHHAQPYRGPSHFPKAAWVSAGQGDPVSALETACWAARQGDGKAMLASLTPELQRQLHTVWKNRAKGQRMSEEDFLAAAARRPFGDILGFRVLGVQFAKGNQAFLHIYVQGWWKKLTLIMKKTGDAWQVAGIRGG